MSTVTPMGPGASSPSRAAAARCVLDIAAGGPSRATAIHNAVSMATPHGSQSEQPLTSCRHTIMCSTQLRVAPHELAHTNHSHGRAHKHMHTQTFGAHPPSLPCKGSFLSQLRHLSPLLSSGHDITWSRLRLNPSRCMHKGSTSQATCVLVNNPYVTDTWPTRLRGDSRFMRAAQDFGVSLSSRPEGGLGRGMREG